jgi:hypothetical protein
MVEYAKARDIKPEDYVPLVKTFGSNAKDFIKVQRDVLASEKQAAINTYSVPLRR